MESFFGEVREAPPIEVFCLSDAFQLDGDANKVNLTVGAYRSDENKPWVLPCVRSVERSMAATDELNKEYLPITGLESMCTCGLKLVLGENNPLIADKKADSCQALGGTGAVFLALQFLHSSCKCTTAYISRPTWPNHKGIAEFTGLRVKEYRYWDPVHRNVDFDGMLTDIGDAPERAIIILHACAHNPTGMDLSREQWTKVAALIKDHKLFPLFDLAYQGFASGDLDNDAWAVRYFATMEIEMFVAQSFSKNFGLYNERVGNLAFITNDPVATSNVKSQLKIIVRRCWSNPPQHGARIVATILSDAELCKQWKASVRLMAERVKLMRQMLYDQLSALNTPGYWEHILQQIGMFSFTGLSKSQAEHMRARYHVYLMSDGRINMCGLTTTNIEYVAKAIHDTLRSIPAD